MATYIGFRNGVPICYGPNRARVEAHMSQWRYSRRVEVVCKSTARVLYGVDIKKWVLEEIE